ncbi:MAG: hypothetical protein BGO12_16400 [Verrucomicrobia bacterium 61-8]|nr:hypothetical protein [Verrucomicrobiota bacterium]OJV16136.1 MAG: hypothetical protein BGO12_16400 [Verrucomicrobia bacterium 61-8]
MRPLLFLACLGLASPAMAENILAPPLSGIRNTDDLAQYLSQSGRRVLYEKGESPVPVHIPAGITTIEGLLACDSVKTSAGLSEQDDWICILPVPAVSAPFRTMIHGLSLREATPREAIQAVAKSTGIPLTPLLQDRVASRQRITINFDGVTIHDALRRIASAIGKSKCTLHPGDPFFVNMIEFSNPPDPALVQALIARERANTP